MSVVLKAAGLAALAAVGMLLAVALPSGGRAADTTTTEVTTATTTETTTEPTTVVTTTTVEQTTTKEVTVPEPTTTATQETSGNGGIPVWVWVLIGVLVLALILVVLLLTRRGGRKALSVDAQRRLLESALGTWALQGWAIQSQTADTAVLQRAGEQMLVSVDPYGSVTARPLPPSAPGR